MIRLVVKPISAEAFAPFGAVIAPPPGIARTAFAGALANHRAEARAALSASRALPKTLPIVSTTMERHRFSSQTFLPLDVERYVVVVAPDGAGGGPDMSRGQAFLVPGDCGINYAADAWHHPMIVLDRQGCFAVLLWRDGTASDIETVQLDAPFEIVER